MKRKTIWGNMIVKNEDRYVWFAVKGVIDFIDKLLIYDTGSTDGTISILSDLVKEYPDKIIFEKRKNVDKFEYTVLRQEMLDKSECDWILLIDGDEVWFEDSMEKIINMIQTRGDELDLIVNRTINLVGDIYHYLEDKAGDYSLLGRRGHLNIRAVNCKIPGLHFGAPYGKEGFYDGGNNPIQNRDKSRMVFVDAPYLHFTHLVRSSKNDFVMQRRQKYKYEIGNRLPADFQYPKVLYNFPDFIESPWGKMSKGYFIRALLQTPFKKIKRRIK